MANKVVILGTAHGSNVAGKCSPDGKFREYKFSRDVIDKMRPMLEKLGYIVYVDIPEDKVPSAQSVELSKRVSIVNSICRKYGAGNCIYVSIHVNAAGDGAKWMSAGGWAAYTTVGKTNSDKLAECLYNSADKALSGYKRIMEEGKKNKSYSQKQVPLRMDKSDGDCDIESNFYILKHSSCPAVLTENMFQDNKSDVEFLSKPETVKLIAKLHVDGIKLYF